MRKFSVTISGTTELPVEYDSHLEPLLQVLRMGLESRGYVVRAMDLSVGDGGGPVEPFTPAHVGGGYYELSDGTRVRGKDEALAAQAELEG